MGLAKSIDFIKQDESTFAQSGNESGKAFLFRVLLPLHRSAHRIYHVNCI